MRHLLILAAAVAFPAMAQVAPLHVADFETGNLSQWTKLDAAPGTTDRLVVTQSPVAQGRYALKATVKSGDLSNNGARAELVLTDELFSQGEEAWFHWYTMFPADYRPASQWVLFTQWKSGAPYGVPLGFNLHGRTMSMRVMGHKYDAAGQWSSGMLWKEELVTGRWMEFLVHVRWSAGSDGFVQMWKDGQLVVPKTYHPTLDSNDFVYLKLGLYRDRSIGHTQSVFHDGMTIYSTEPTHLTRPPEPEPEPDPEPEDPPADEDAEEGSGEESEEGSGEASGEDAADGSDGGVDSAPDEGDNAEETADGADTSGNGSEGNAQPPPERVRAQVGCSTTGAAPWVVGGLISTALLIGRRRRYGRT